MIESGFDIRSNRRLEIFRKIRLKFQDQNKEIPIGFDFIQKILIWMSASFSTSSFVLFIEFCVKSVNLF